MNKSKIVQDVEYVDEQIKQNLIEFCKGLNHLGSYKKIDELVNFCYENDICENMTSSSAYVRRLIEIAAVRYVSSL